MIEERYGDYRLSSLDPIVITIPDLSVSDEEVTREMERIASRYAANKTVEPHKVGPHDLVQIKISTKEDNRNFPGLSNENVDVRLGVGSLPPEIEEAIVGAEIGDVVDADFVYLDYSEVSGNESEGEGSNCGGEGSSEPKEIKLHSRVTLIAQREVDIPEITDEWVQKRIGLANTVEEFKDRTYKKLRTDRLREYANKVEYDVLEKMGERLVDEVPADVVDSVTNQLLMEFDNFLKSYEMDRETYLLTQGTTEEEFLDQVHQDAHDRVSQDIAVAAYAHQTGVTLDDKDINAMFLQPTPEKSFESRQQAERTGEIENIRDLALRAKTAELLTRSAIFLKEDGSQDEEFQKAVKEKYQKLQAVRDHATAAPMVKRPH